MTTGVGAGGRIDLFLSSVQTEKFGASTCRFFFVIPAKAGIYFVHRYRLSPV